MPKSSRLLACATFAACMPAAAFAQALQEPATMMAGNTIITLDEAGAMKAARNARFRLIPGSVRAQVIAAARQSGQTRVIESQRAAPVEATAERAEAPARVGPYAPTEKQIAFYQRLAESPVFTDEERRRALEWLATKATRQTIKDQIDWLKRQVETRRTRRAGESAA